MWPWGGATLAVARRCPRPTLTEVGDTMLKPGWYLPGVICDQ